MKPKSQKLASLARKYAHSSFSSLVQSLLPKDTLLRTYLTQIRLFHMELSGSILFACILGSICCQSEILQRTTIVDEIFS